MIATLSLLACDGCVKTCLEDTQGVGADGEDPEDQEDQEDQDGPGAQLRTELKLPENEKLRAMLTDPVCRQLIRDQVEARHIRQTVDTKGPAELESDVQKYKQRFQEARKAKNSSVAVEEKAYARYQKAMTRKFAARCKRIPTDACSPCVVCDRPNAVLRTINPCTNPREWVLPDKTLQTAPEIRGFCYVNDVKRNKCIVTGGSRTYILELNVRMGIPDKYECGNAGNTSKHW